MRLECSNFSVLDARADAAPGRGPLRAGRLQTLLLNLLLTQLLTQLLTGP